MRRKVILALGGTMIEPGFALAPVTNRKYRLGILETSAATISDAHWVAFFQHLGAIGLVEGRNLTIERRQADGQLERLPALAAELAKLKCDLFFTGGSAATLAALTGATREIPIVIVAVDFDPVATGDVASLARPGGRVTGVTALQSSLPAKRLELLRELLPSARNVAVLANEQTSDQLSLVQGTARRLGISLHVVDLKRPP